MMIFGRQIWSDKVQLKPQEMTLADVAPGSEVLVAGFSARLSAERRAHLQAYGLAPGYRLRVMQHSPVTVVQIEHIELAMERDLARAVQVQPVVKGNL